MFFFIILQPVLYNAIPPVTMAFFSFLFLFCFHSSYTNAMRAMFENSNFSSGKVQ